MCQRCGQAPATVHLTHIVNGHKSERHLCEACAVAEGVMPTLTTAWGPSISVGQLLGGLLPTGGFGTVTERAGATCPECGWTLPKLQETGRLGCDQCYTAFGPALDPLVRRIQGSTEHRGKIPLRQGSDARRERELERLKHELQAAIAREEFEEAARLRDRIRELERGQGERP
ncbi:MAG: UvrB/UvrC motif-containing protein [Actinomycetia bacterium]|nr:UvrB/UvrC motif-containing protein [Actinomycetes bacterium]